ncbi:hypothetical protein EIN_113730 [Entamoeba invadens IP1]|uniref:Transmembrane protein n=1 Tax=Entamoeba invadens IP1 TaxID=370355 RepID=A0A0A1U3T4_ENTIV|nr:hypothetical protein EIN_113730 [Entamoeba invadens IP1]ELP86259.1 hypothetical protein EIN_113730 [Entamoeba invadens IP1]|eukprot:XP_004185605.1 hypothetical protein EIN_113730 [Entamoeba invadens IP1]
MDIVREDEQVPVDDANRTDPFNIKEANPNEKYFPYCVVWSTIPLISWFIPFVGHTGIGDSNGWIYDFQGSYSIGKRRQTTCFGSVKKYIPIELMGVSDKEYDDAIDEMNKKYQSLQHLLIIQNCHEHVGDVLSKVRYQNKTNWGTLSMLWLIATQSKYVSSKEILKTYGPFFVICCVLLAIVLFCIALFR